MQDVANVFLAMSVCPEHLDYVPQKAMYRTWAGKLLTPAEVAALQLPDGSQKYLFENRSDGGPPECYSPQERTWGLHLPLTPDRVPFTIDRVLPLPMLVDGELRFSARVPGTLRMAEGVVTVYVVGRLVYSAAQLAAAQRAHREGRKPDQLLVETVSVSGDEAPADPEPPASPVQPAAATDDDSLVGGLTDSVTSGVGRVLSVAKSLTSRLIRKK